MRTVLDMHVHTVKGSPDSELSLPKLVKTAKNFGLTAVCITEHDKMWDHRERIEAAEDYDFGFVHGMEVVTDLGHVLVYGLDSRVSGLHIATNLRKTVKAAGGIMVAAHPFRKFFYEARIAANGNAPVIPSLDEIANWQIFQLVDEIEVLNGGTGELENFFALQVAKYLGFEGVAGSDAHSVLGLGRYATVFQSEIAAVGDLINAIRSHQYYAAEISLEEEEPQILHYADGVVEADLEFRLRAYLLGGLPG